MLLIEFLKHLTEINILIDRRAFFLSHQTGDHSKTGNVFSSNVSNRQTKEERYFPSLACIFDRFLKNIVLKFCLIFLNIDTLWESISFQQIKYMHNLVAHRLYLVGQYFTIWHSDNLNWTDDAIVQHLTKLSIPIDRLGHDLWYMSMTSEIVSKRLIYF